MEVNNKRFDLRKFIITFIVFTACMFLSGFFTGKAFASTAPVVNLKNFTTESLPYAIYYNSQTAGIYKVMVTDKKLVNMVGDVDALAASETVSYMVYTYNTETSTFEVTKTLSSIEALGVMFYLYNDNGTSYSTILNSNYNVYTMENGVVTNTVFFSAPNLPLLPQSVQALQLRLTLAQVLSLLPLLIPLVVGFLGLRKGLATLQAILKQA